MTVLRAKQVEEKEKALGAERLRASSQLELKDEPDAPRAGNHPIAVASPNDQSSMPVLVTTATTEPSRPSKGSQLDSDPSNNQFDESDALKSEIPGASAEQNIDGPSISEALESNGLDASDFNKTTAEADLDSMFADTTGNPEDSINFDLDFPNDQTASQDLLSGNSFGNLGPSADDFNNINLASSEDIDSLLPGLESYVDGGGNGGEDFAMVDIPATDVGRDASKTTKTDITNSAKEDTSMLDTTNMDTGVDDMFDVDFDADETMNNTDFDEWFRT